MCEPVGCERPERWPGCERPSTVCHGQSVAGCVIPCEGLAAWSSEEQGESAACMPDCRGHGMPCEKKSGPEGLRPNPAGAQIQKCPSQHVRDLCSQEMAPSQNVAGVSVKRKTESERQVRQEQSAARHESAELQSPEDEEEKSQKKRSKKKTAHAKNLGKALSIGIKALKAECSFEDEVISGVGCSYEEFLILEKSFGVRKQDFGHLLTVWDIWEIQKEVFAFYTNTPTTDKEYVLGCAIMGNLMRCHWLSMPPPHTYIKEFIFPEELLKPAFPFHQPRVVRRSHAWERKTRKKGAVPYAFGNLTLMRHHISKNFKRNLRFRPFRLRLQGAKRFAAAAKRRRRKAKQKQPTKKKSLEKKDRLLTPPEVVGSTQATLDGPHVAVTEEVPLAKPEIVSEQPAQELPTSPEIVSEKPAQELSSPEVRANLGLEIVKSEGEFHDLAIQQEGRKVKQARIFSFPLPFFRSEVWAEKKKIGRITVFGQGNMKLRTKIPRARLLWDRGRSGGIVVLGKLCMVCRAVCPAPPAFVNRQPHWLAGPVSPWL